MRGFATVLVVLVVLVGLLSYLVLPGVIEDQLARRLQQAFGLPTEPDVEISSNFPPELLLGRIDRLQVRADQINLQGFTLGNAQADLQGVSVSVPSLLQGELSIQTQTCSLRAETPPVSIEQGPECLTYLGLGG